jgi:hypothetical protein
VNRGEQQSDEWGTLRQPEQHSKARWMHGDAQRGLVMDLEEFDISHLSALGVI